jgi:RNA polymerase sigma-70 factor, ECF subfamily
VAHGGALDRAALRGTGIRYRRDRPLPCRSLRCHLGQMENPLATDAQLVCATLGGSLAAFERLVLRHQGRLFLQAMSYVRVKEEAQDAVQDAFLMAYSQLHTLKEPAKFPSWTARMVRNICLNRLRAGRRQQAMATTAAETSQAENHSEPPVFASAALQQLVAQLPARSAEAFRLHYLEGFSVTEVAVTVGATASIVKQRLYRARKQLQEEATRMARDSKAKDDLPERFAAHTIARLLEQGRRDRLHMRMDEARARFREALEVAPDHPEALVELGCTFDPVSGPSEEEAASIERAAEAAPESIEAACALTVARAHDRARQHAAIEKCLALCDAKLAADADDSVALTVKAQMHLWREDFLQMEAVSRRAVAAAPDDQRSLNYLALSLCRQDRRDEALPVYEEMVAINGKTVWAYFALRQIGTWLGFHKGDWTGAARAQEKVWALTGRPTEAGSLIYFYGRAGMEEEAKALFGEVKDHPHPARVYEVVGEAAPQ